MDTLSKITFIQHGYIDSINNLHVYDTQNGSVCTLLSDSYENVLHAGTIWFMPTISSLNLNGYKCNVSIEMLCLVVP